MKIILIGFIGSGKTTVAKKLGSFLKMPVIEMDALVLEKTNTKSMQEVFEKGGELLLRETEIAIAKEYAFQDHVIISTGGGVVLNKIVLDYLKHLGGQVIFLNASFQIIADRLKNDLLRPLFSTIDEAKSLYDFRKPLYLKYADKIVEVDKKSLEEIVRDCSEIICTSRLQESPGVERSKTTPYCNIGSFSIVQPRELSCSLDVQIISEESLRDCCHGK